MNSTRRQWLLGLSSLGAGAILIGCNKGVTSEANEAKEANENAEPEVTATEDLMREHGVLRRALLVYQETAAKLQGDAAIPPEPLQKTAKLFRDFGEEYHEKKLEEVYIFPAVRKASGAAGSYADILIAQHQRGREITDFILAATADPKISSGNVKSFANALESLVRMYEHHAAIEDTIVFPAWKQTLNSKQLDEMNEKFEEIEHEQFGEDGFEHALQQMAAIEQSLGLSDLAQFTAPPPPAK
ncbi:MAG TPA: hemerythrin HHE cation-binding protein [Blastocatellia bacterium]|jgi:hemerythrin-like domain-containing protein|nr:hemerythrin HHE cation-binding protein [Blastocatellia bacterium]